MLNKTGVLSLIVCVGVLVSALVGCGSGGGSNGGGGGGTPPGGPAPVLTSVTPSVALAGSPAVLITLTASNLTNTAQVKWNGVPLNVSFTPEGKLIAQVPSADLATAGTATVTVVSPAQGGGTSNGVTFTIKPASTSVVRTIPITANSLAWDPVNEVIYLSLPSTDSVNGNSVQVLNPSTGVLGAAVIAGSEPNLLSVSANSKYLYVGLDGASAVQRMTLPGLGMDIQIPVVNDQIPGPYLAFDLQAAPDSDATVAVKEKRGVVIYDDATARPDTLCGWNYSPNVCSSPSPAAAFDSIQWNSDGSEMYAANTESTGLDFYTVPVTSSGFGTVTDYGGLVGWLGAIHYDKTTKYVYDDNGLIIDPSKGQIAGKFFDVLSSSGRVYDGGTMVPDGSLGLAFFLVLDRSNSAFTTYRLESFDIKSFTQIAVLSIPNVVGVPTHLIRWGTNGLAFTTGPAPSPSTSTGSAVYIVSGSFFQQ